MISVLIESFDPLPRHLCLSLPPSATAADIVAGFGLAVPGTAATRFSVIHHGRSLRPTTTLAGLDGARSSHPVLLQLRVPLPGGKGGFGSMLRSQGGKMSSGTRKTNNDSCRDLNGRRLGVMKEAKKLAEYLEGESERKRKMDEAQRKKYAKLEKMLGRTPKTEKDLVEAAERMADAGEDFQNDSASPSPEAGPSDSARTRSSGHSTSSQVAGEKRKERIEDPEFIEQSREIVENVRSAVAAAMMKKKKKKQKLGKGKDAGVASSSSTSRSLLATDEQANKATAST